MDIFKINIKENQQQDIKEINTNFYFYQIEFKNNKLYPIFFDDYITEILGFTAKEVENNDGNQNSFFDEEYKNNVYSIFEQIREKPGHYEFKRVFKNKKGLPVFMRSKGVCYFDEANNVYKYLGCVDAISSEEIENYANKSSNKILKQAYGSGSVGTFYYDIKLNKLHWSEEVKKMHGYETEPSIEEFGELIQSKEKFSTTNIIKKVAESKNGYQSIYSFTRKDETEKLYILTIMFPIIDDKKNLIAISGNVINIFDPKDNEYILPKTESKKKNYTEEDFVFIKQHNQHIKLPIKDIVAVSSMRDYIQIYTNNRIPPYIHYTTLYKFKEILPENLFFQIHRSHIINLSMINKVTTNQLVVNELTFPVSRNYRPKLMSIINR